MLKPRLTRARVARASQQGMVLLVALVVLVAIMVGGIAMIRSTDTATLVAGNLAFQQSATHAADIGVEQAVAMLRGKLADGSLSDNDTSNGYYAAMRPDEHNPSAGQTWQDFWNSSLKNNAVDAGTDSFDNHIYYVVNRLCAQEKPPGSGGQCVASPVVTKSTGNADEPGLQLNAASQIYYRITVRVAGPRRTESYVQTNIAM